MEVRTRFAPSPTGYMHIGNLRSALFTYLTAKSMGGKFILRIEDTDQERKVGGAVEFILNTLNMLGLHPDEGAGVGGDFGPYYQSERLDIYKKYAEELVEKGDAYYCFCDEAMLNNQRMKANEEKKPKEFLYHTMSACVICFVDNSNQLPGCTGNRAKRFNGWLCSF